ncbi:MAG: VOC family protein [Verrucomicrobiaceae bacterium]|jgi:catechol 2,3-dioxygenase-like lactoylglutathione lyase family enzyme|nr:VOC family protein [Verrucomicrobiaceae bacterium]
MNPPDREVECTIPILPVRNLERSVQFYTQTLGFHLDWRGGPVCSVSRDARPIMLKESLTATTSAWVWIGLESDSLFHLYREQGVKVLQEPMNWSWAYEMKFEDPDGNVLWLGTEPRDDLPKQDTP